MRERREEDVKEEGVEETGGSDEQKGGGGGGGQGDTEEKEAREEDEEEYSVEEVREVLGEMAKEMMGNLQVWSPYPPILNPPSPLSLFNPLQCFILRTSSQW